MDGRSEPADGGFWRAENLLPGIVASVVGYTAVEPQERVHRGVPSPYLTFIFSLDDPIVCADAPDALGTLAEQRTAIITGGLHTRPAYVAMPKRQSGIQLAIHPLAARTLFGARSSELGFPVTDGVDLLGAEAERVRQQMIEARDWERRFGLLADYLRKRLQSPRHSSRVRPELVEAWRWLGRSRGRRSVDQLADHVALSNRQLSDLFSREVGLGPKGVGRLIRFQHAIRDIRGPAVLGGEVDLAGVAATHGYYDQSHLIRDFRGYVGISPTGWLREEHRNVQADTRDDGQADDHDRDIRT